jgi:hypothetical protein
MAIQIHTSIIKKYNYRKGKFCYSNLFLITGDQTLPVITRNTSSPEAGFELD